MGRVPKDGGWGWMCVFSAGIFMFFVVGGFKSLGIIFVALLEKYESDAAVTAWIIGLLNVSMSLFAPLSGVLGERYSFRLLAGIGGVCASVACVLSAFSTSIIHFILVFSLPVGLGTACMMGNPLSVVGQYFEARRSLANGMTMAGASVGQLLIPLLITALLQEYGFMGALLIYGSLYLHTIVAAFLLRPLSFYTRWSREPKQESMAKQEKVEDETSKCQNNANAGIEDQEKSLYRERSDSPLVVRSVPDHYSSTGSLDIVPHQRVPDCLRQYQDDNHVSKSPSEPEGTSPTCAPCRNICNVQGKPLFDWSLLKNPLFLSYAFGLSVGNSGYVNVILFMPPHAQDLGVDKTKAAMLLSMCGLADFFGRIAGGWFADLGYIQRNKMMALALCLTGVTSIVCSSLPYFWSLIVLSLVTGLIGGGYISLMAVVLIDYCGIHSFSQAFGLAIMFMGFFNLSVPTVFGKIRDVYGSYQIPFIICGCFMLTASISIFSGTYIQRWQRRRQHSADQQAECDAGTKKEDVHA